MTARKRPEKAQAEMNRPHNYPTWGITLGGEYGNSLIGIGFFHGEFPKDSALRWALWPTRDKARAARQTLPEWSLNRRPCPRVVRVSICAGWKP